MNRIEVNLSSGKSRVIPLTPVEVAEIEARPVPPPPVYSCTPWQIRTALNQLGLREAVEETVAASSNITLKDGWEYATEFRSDDQLVLLMGADIGKNADQTREMIKYAGTL